MTYLAIFRLLLQLASMFGRWLDKATVEKEFANALLLAIDKRADAAVAAADAVRAGGMPDDADPNRRD